MRVVLQNVFELFEEVGIKLRRLKMKTRSVGIYLRGEENMGGHKTVQFYMDKGVEMFTTVTNAGLFYNLKNVKYIRQISVWAGYLKESQNVPLSLFDIDGKKEKLTKVISTKLLVTIQLGMGFCYIPQN